jgi:hydroxymethylbilane synthase
LREFRIGSRGSRLALVQAHGIIDALKIRDPDAEVALEIIQTQGDRVVDRPLSRIGDSGLFIKEIETALLEHRIDVAVHSMKDVPSRVPEGLALTVTTKRADPRDVLVSRNAGSIEDLPSGATVATGSLRRRSQLLAARPDLEVVDLRGNVPTRLEKFDRSSWEAIVLAGAGLTRLGLSDRIRAYIPVSAMIPAVGQGALALETRSDDEALRDRLEFLNHEPTALAVAAERSLLARLEGGCQVPIGAHGEIFDGGLVLRGYVGSLDGRKSIRREIRGPAEEGARLGLELAEAMLEAGADAIIRDAELEAQA